MNNHVKEKLSAYLNHELPQPDRQAIAEHLLTCQSCRAEHDEIKLGISLAGNLQRTDAPENTWNEIQAALNGKKPEATSLLPQITFFNSRGLFATFLALLVVIGLATVVYLNLFRDNSPQIAEYKPTPDIQGRSIVNSAIEAKTPDLVTINSNGQAATNNSVTTVTSPVQTSQNDSNKLTTKQNPATSFWQVEAISGSPTTGNQTISKNGALTVGEFLETDQNSRARVQVANIGQVEIAPNSRVQLVKTQSTEHRLSLERGVLQAKIFAPPRLFIVDTPSAVAVDLGCAYKLEVDKAGNSKLHVTSGYVALERDGLESIVPAGATCLTHKGKGIGTPFFDDASLALQAALNKFDFANGGSDSVKTIIKESRPEDSLTLWHLLSRVSQTDRAKIFNTISSFAKPPANVTREGILKLDRKMLERWKEEIESLWY